MQIRCKVTKHCVAEILISRNCVNRRPPVICDFVMRKMHEKYKQNCIERILDNFMMILVFKLKVAFFQKVLMHLSFPQTLEPFYFPDHKNLNFCDV